MSKKSNIRLSARDEELNNLVKEMAKSINFRISGKNQVVKHYWKAEDSEVKLYFLRHNRHMLFSFEGFGDLLGYVITITNAEESIVPAPIGINGDVTLYIATMLPNKVKVELMPPQYNSW